MGGELEAKCHHEYRIRGQSPLLRTTFQRHFDHSTDAVRNCKTHRNADMVKITDISFQGTQNEYVSIQILNGIRL